MTSLFESDLSTYSAHLSKMKNFVEMASGKTLVLIDEFGTGTDPQFGGPIAEAVLETLNHKKVKGVITTHYSNLKVFASHTPKVSKMPRCCLITYWRCGRFTF